MREGFVPFTQAADRIGVSRPTLRRMIADGELILYRNPRDKRQRLVALDELDRCTAPRPIAPRSEEVLPQPA